MTATVQAPDPGSAPTTAKGVVSEFASGVPGWGGFAPDVLELTRAFIWPQTILTVAEMRSDAQLSGLYRAVTLPIRRQKWQINPNGAPKEMANKLSRDYNLPLKGQKDFNQFRSRKRFNFREHLALALLALLYGHYVFEQVGEVADDDLLWHIKRAEARPPETISEFNVAANGNLNFIRQNVALQANGGQAQPIEIDRLIAYPWDKEGANWQGRSMFRDCYKPWTIKDRVLRVGAINIERAGGVPYIKAPQGASPHDIARLDLMARRFRVGDRAGGAIPFGSELALAKAAGGDDAVGYVNLQNQEMARSWLAMFINLGQTQSGSRALGSSLIDFFAEAMGSVTDWFIGIFNAYVIEDDVEWNWGGSSDYAPMLEAVQVEDERASIHDLAEAVKEGLIEVDDELEAYIRDNYRLPEKGTPRPSATPPPLDVPQTTDPTPPPAPAPNAPATTPPAPATAAARRQRRTVAAVIDATSPITLPDRPLRRQPYEQEVRAAVDYSAMESLFQLQRDSLFTNVMTAQSRQISELHDAIVGAAGDLAALASIQADPVAADLIRETMTNTAQAAIKDHVQEARNQGVKEPKSPPVSDLEKPIAARAAAVDQVLANGISQAARTRAIRLSGGSLSPAEVAAEVETALRSLTGSEVKARLSGAIQAAMNSGRKLAMRENDPKEIYSSELLDEATCQACVDEDGTQFDTLDEAESDYASGGYNDCFGGDNCRGTLVAVYATEADATT